MNRDQIILRRGQVDRLFADLLKVLPKIPKKGWVSEFRVLFQMNSRQLAKRLGVSQSTISKFEASEVKKTITLASLEKLADALNCDLHYMLVPREKIETVLFQRASGIIEARNKKVKQTMALEDQSVDLDLRRDIEAALLLNSIGSKIWEE